MRLKIESDPDVEEYVKGTEEYGAGEAELNPGGGGFGLVRAHSSNGP